MYVMPILISFSLYNGAKREEKREGNRLFHPQEDLRKEKEKRNNKKGRENIRRAY